MKKVLLALAFVLGIGSVSHAQALVPEVVYTKSVIGQTGSNNLGVVYTTALEGLYRVNGSFLYVSGSCTPSSIKLSWTGNTDVELGTSSVLVYVIPSSTQISLSFTACGTGVYDAFVTIEKIG